MAKIVSKQAKACDSPLFFNPIQLLNRDVFLTAHTIEDKIDNFHKFEIIYKKYGDVISDLDHGTSIWANINAHPEGKYLEGIKNDPKATHLFLNNMFNTPITNGFAQSVYHFSDFKENPASIAHMYSLMLDKLLRLASYFRIIREYNPEQPYDSEYINALCIDEILDSVQDRVPFDISAPMHQGSLFGIQTKYGLFTERHFTSIYNCVRLLENFPRRGIEICEIGGGYGLQAFYLAKCGYKISLVDVSWSSLCSAHFLVSNDLNVNLFEYGSEQITLFLPQHVAEIRSKVFVNFDSIPEIGRLNAEHYLKKIASNSGTLYSVNQEACTCTSDGRQFKVAEIADGKLLCSSRHPDWMRKGYVCEIWNYPKSFLDKVYESGRNAIGMNK